MLLAPIGALTTITFYGKATMATDESSKPGQLGLFDEASPPEEAPGPAKKPAWNKGKPHSEEHKSALKTARKARGPHSAETRAKMSAAHKGRRNTPEHNANIAKARTGTKRLPSTVEKMRIASTGKKMPEWFKEELRKKFSTPETNPAFGQTPVHAGPRGRWIEYRGIKFRSSYEVRFVKALDARGWSWQYEPQRFNLGSCTYLPDFFVDKLKAYVEVKGWLDPQSKKRISLFRELHPKLPLIVATDQIIRMFE